MESTLPSYAENMALKACELKPFHEINLVGLRHGVTELLGEIGTGGIFEDYTKHDITHIDAMLDSLEWIIPEDTRSKMKPTDWLLTVLSIYFHDLGMLVTKDEFRLRGFSSFSAFKEDVLLTDDNQGRDYKARIDDLATKGVDVEKFLYQEFVRHYHAIRVRNWIVGHSTKEYGSTDAAHSEVVRLLENLPAAFRRDLGLVCESHHLDDLEDVEKYSVSKPYGTSKEAVANVQYAAVLLRTVDLLHITSDRTPSITFRVLNPSDPVSQLEWSKQQAVAAVRPKTAINAEGELDLSLLPDSVEVHAFFTDGNSYFGLMSYLQYAEQQLRKSHEWVARSNRSYASEFTFPWKSIDTNKIHVEGFLPQQFKFDIDQEKILDLLTGHTLYNDSNVVLRELLQNSIDAVRLQREVSGRENGQIRISWDTETRTLEVRDNGCGMTQAIIENNLLKAGASRYQEPDFRKKYPDFNPISRFGIGVMSAFMIADQVEIITSHPEESEARQLTLRSVHGKYLVRILEKEELEASIKEHGTIVRLTVRPSAEIDDVLDTARRWIVVPDCSVTCAIDDLSEVRVGHASLKESLESFLVESSLVTREQLMGQKVRVDVAEKNGASIAYALRWNDYFRQWEFFKPQLQYYSSGRRLSREQASLAQYAPGICVEGVRVESSAPGYKDRNGIMALVNVYGKDAPRTNVARSSLDETPEKKILLAKIYEAYCDHIRDQCNELHRDHGYSLTWACSEAQYLSASLTSGNCLPSSFKLLQEAIREIPLAVLESQGTRRQASVAEISSLPHLYMRISNFSDHVEALLREVPVDVSLHSLLDFLGDADDPIPADWNLLCSRIGGSGVMEEHLSTEWEISALTGRMIRRSCDVTWSKKGDQPRWSPGAGNRVTQEMVEHLRMVTTMYERDVPLRNLLRIPLSDVSTDGFLDRYIGVKVGTEHYLLKDHPWHWAVESVNEQSDGPEQLNQNLILLSWLITASVVGLNRASIPDLYESMTNSPYSLDFINLKKFQDSCEIATSMQFFDAQRWTRGHQVGGL
ncbi:HD domain-containing protein [Streptomyces sp. NPDC005143]